MPIDPDQLLAARIPSTDQQYHWRDCVLYALGIGVGLDPMDESDLAFVDETRLKVEPTMVNVLGDPGFWMRDMPLGLDWVRTVHGEQALRIHRPLAGAASVRGVTRIVGLADKGAGRGALIYVERDIQDLADGALLATVYQTVFCRGDGGFGGTDIPRPAPPPVPDRQADQSVLLDTSPQSALIYRLSGDLNPLHADPAVARQAGYARPVLHGLASFGAVGHALLKACCGGEPAPVRSMGGRFSAPVFPGETLGLDIWRTGPGRYAFRASVPSRQAVVIDHGHFEVEA
ncbi:MaoC/PaaZ C-terminal domain-containing protein [Bordetella petrii]|uniref:MaoC/PaaZ C-terminal domain-containing protein n=1 Tax=Bordetella petrii TaxID=94624 RepID=UPI001E29190C|nr:MaoC/PaaZ C-terminal domain-containing protein [Bordetella petrii]MCD0504944.1 3-alpha,7-alpha,12-alpha-trihydroxy-5-beta-cholest-24-enoyl-CoA hydratase [Bordetella petrii]